MMRDSSLARSTPGTDVAADDHAGSRSSTTQAAGAAAVDRIVGEVDLCAFVDSVDRTQLTMDELKNTEVGHSFLRFRPKHGAHAQQATPTSFGFWPAGDVGHNPLHSYGPGQVHEPDEDASAPTGWETYSVTETQLAKLLAYKQEKQNAQYSVYFYNCTTFAEGAIKAAGLPLPNSGILRRGVLPREVYAGLGALTAMSPILGGVAQSQLARVSTPNDLYTGILQHKADGDANAHTTPLGKSEEGPNESEPDLSRPSLKKAMGAVAAAHQGAGASSAHEPTAAEHAQAMTPAHSSHGPVAAPEPEHVVAARAQEKVYVVKHGDSLAAIAVHLWGKHASWKPLWDANRAVVHDPSRIHVGMHLTIPDHA